MLLLLSWCLNILPMVDFLKFLLNVRNIGPCYIFLDKYIYKWHEKNTIVVSKIRANFMAACSSNYTKRFPWQNAPPCSLFLKQEATTTVALKHWLTIQQTVSFLQVTLLHHTDKMLYLQNGTMSHQHSRRWWNLNRCTRCNLSHPIATQTNIATHFNLKYYI